MPMYDVIHNQDKTERLFENPILEKLSHIHPATPIVAYTPVITYFLIAGAQAVSWPYAVAVFLAGVLFWTFLEYTMHRFLFHWPFEITSKLGQRIHFLIHGVHHSYPRDSRRLVMPLPVSVPLALLFYALFAWLLAPYHQAAFSGLIAGYVIYDTMHFAIHHFTLKSRLFNLIKSNHLSHHYADHDRSFGVSSPLWDYVFRTERRSQSSQYNDGQSSNSLQS